MPFPIMHPHPHAVKHNRVGAPTAEAQADMERQIGRNLYRRGRGFDACTTPAMKDGYLAEQGRCEDAYYRAMMADASALKSVNWTGEGW